MRLQSYMIFSTLQADSISFSLRKLAEDMTQKIREQCLHIDLDFTSSLLIQHRKPYQKLKKQFILTATPVMSTKGPKVALNSKSSALSIMRRAKLIQLGDWVRFTASSLKLQKKQYNRAISLLKKTMKSEISSYSIAAAALILIIKFQRSSLFKQIQELPIGCSSPNHPTVSIYEAFNHQIQILKANNFRIPKDTLNDRLVQVCEKWSLYLKSNRKHMTIPLKYLQTGINNCWQRRNLYCVAFLVDIILISQSNFLFDCQLQQKIHEFNLYIITCAILITGATNSCTTDKINTGKYILFTFIRGFLKKCFKLCQQSLLPLQSLLNQCVKQKLWKKLRYVPTNIKEANSAQFMLNKLEYIPMYSYDQS